MKDRAGEDAVTTLTRMLASNAENFGDEPFVSMYSRTGFGSTLTYQQAWHGARQWAQALAEHGVEADEPVVLALPNSPEFVEAYFGTLLLGAVPAPAYAPNDADDRLALDIIAERSHELAGAAVILPDESADTAGLGRVIRCGDASAANDVARSPRTDGGETALLQFTSGTTARSKVVELTNDALLYQAGAIADCLKLDCTVDSAVSWLPLAHDMGLIGFVITTSRVQGRVTLIPTSEFTADTSVWLRAMHDSGATITGATPSALALTVLRLRGNSGAGIDLSRLRIMLVGAEPVAKEMVEFGVAGLERVGLRRSAIMPTYGLAENGLAVTMPPLGRGPHYDAIGEALLSDKGVAVEDLDPAAETKAVTALGPPIPGTAVEIIGPDGRTLPERAVGEIVVESPSLMLGYRGRADLTAETRKGDRLHTGDLGYLADGELHFVGRIKEVIVSGGRKFAPESLENRVAFVPGVRRGKALAFNGRADGLRGETVVMLVECGVKDIERRNRVRLEVRQTLTSAGFPIDEVVLVEPRTLRRTPNGKILRLKYRDLYLAGDFDNV